MVQEVGTRNRPESETRCILILASRELASAVKRGHAVSRALPLLPAKAKELMRIIA